MNGYQRFGRCQLDPRMTNRIIDPNGVPGRALPLSNRFTGAMLQLAMQPEWGKGLPRGA